MDKEFEDLERDGTFTAADLPTEAGGDGSRMDFQVKYPSKQERSLGRTKNGRT